MTTQAQQFLASFEQLSPAEQLLVAKEIKSRVEASSNAFDDVDFSPMEAEEHIFMARKIFQMYDEEEARRDGHA